MQKARHVAGLLLCEFCGECCEPRSVLYPVLSQEGGDFLLDGDFCEVETCCDLSVGVSVQSFALRALCSVSSRVLSLDCIPCC